MSDILFEGLLQKPGRIPGRKTKVWSVLSGTELLFYRENKRSSCIGSLELSLVRKVEKVVSDGNEFRVDHDGSLHIYAAEDSVKCDEWVTHILEAVLQAVQTAGGYNKQVPFGQNTEKFKVEASRKSDRADDKKISIQSKIKSFLPSGNKQKSTSQTREQTTLVKKDSQGEKQCLYEEEELRRRKDKRQNSLSKPSVKEPVTLLKKQKSVESHFTKSTPPPRKGCTNDSITSPQEFVQRDSEINGTESKNNVCVLPIKKSQEKISACNKHEVSGTFKSFQDTDRSSSSLWTTGKDTRPDSGYETLAGSENRRSVITEDYGEIDISQVVLRKSRLSVNSLTMSSSENEVPKDEPVPISKEIQDTNQEQDSLYENHINDTKRDDSKQKSTNNEHLETDLTVESIRNHENVDAVKREEKGKGPCDKPVPMRRSRVSKRSTLIDVNVPRVVVEDEEGDEKGDDTKEMSLDGDMLTEEQEEMLVNLTFDPIDEIPYKSDDMEKDDFSEIREIVKHRNTRTRNSFIPENNPVEKLREVLQQL